MLVQRRALYGNSEFECHKMIRKVLHSNRFPHFLMQLHIYITLNDAERDDSTTTAPPALTLTKLTANLKSKEN